MEAKIAPTTKTNKIRLLGLVILGILLLGIPAGIGFILLRKPAANFDLVSISTGENSEISDEVYASVLSRPTASDEVGVDNSSTDTTSETTSRIKVLLDDEVIAIPNGGLIPWSENIQLEVFIAPYPPTGFDVDVDFYLTTLDGEPITDAEIEIDYDMMFMAHGPFFNTPNNLNNGHYISSYDFFMFGPWILETYIDTPTQGGSAYVPISIYVWPGN